MLTEQDAASIMLEEEIRKLERKVEEQKHTLSYIKELSKRRDSIGKIPVSKYSSQYDRRFRIGMYDMDKLKSLPDFSTRWIHSVYVTEQSRVEQTADGCFSKDCLSLTQHFLTAFLVHDAYRHSVRTKFVCMLDAVIPKSDGSISLILSDPFDTIQVSTKQNAAFQNDIYAYIGYMVITVLEFSEDSGPVCLSITEY